VALLTRIKGPRDLDRLSQGQLVELAEEIRTFLVDAVSKTGGHLGPNLGVVELTIAMHRVFDSPKDKVLFDTGHQSYVHKLLTGRQDFSSSRTATPPRSWAGPTVWPRPIRCSAVTTVSWPSSVMARSPAVWRGRP
jgi:deoxyxylulose-5-phosphate synthase